MKVILAVDGTDKGEKAAEAIANWARDSGATVHLYSVVNQEKVHETAAKPQFGHSLTPRGTASGLALRGVAEPYAAMAEDRGQAMSRASAEREDYLHGLEARVFGGVATSVRVGEAANVASAIVDEARSTEANLIAMAARGRSNVSHALFGSVHEDVVRTAMVPVLLVGPGA